jgi:hypothetical protein
MPVRRGQAFCIVLSFQSKNCCCYFLGGTAGDAPGLLDGDGLPPGVVAGFVVLSGTDDGCVFPGTFDGSVVLGALSGAVDGCVLELGNVEDG